MHSHRNRGAVLSSTRPLIAGRRRKRKRGCGSVKDPDQTWARKVSCTVLWQAAVGSHVQGGDVVRARAGQCERPGPAGA